MSLYLDNGYLDVEKIISKGDPFNFIVGGRGIGKTYGAIKYCIDNKIKFIYMRRTDTIIQTIVNGELSPVRPVLEDEGKISETEKINKYITGFYKGIENDNGKIVPCGDLLGIAVGLSVIGNMRGWSAADYDILINDEFIPEKHERPLKNEAMAFFNAYETINRNRELKGRKPLQALFLANSNDLTNDYFLTLKLINTVDQMFIQGVESFRDPARGIGVYVLHNSPISEEKKKTALYQLTEGTEYSEMALDNNFVWEDRGTIASRDLREYRSLVRVGELCIYRHKSKIEYYACLHTSGTPDTYATTDIELRRFTSSYIYLWAAYLQNNIIFETYTCEGLFRKYFK